MSEKIKKDLSVTCGTCGVKFKDNDAYLDHTCSVTGFTPRDPQHFGERFMLQQKEALKRGGSLTKTREKEIDAQIKEAREKGVDDKLMVASEKAKK